MSRESMLIFRLEINSPEKKADREIAPHGLGTPALP
jgi:hypothetical protein